MDLAVLTSWRYFQLITISCSLDINFKNLHIFNDPSCLANAAKFENSPIIRLNTRVEIVCLLHTRKATWPRNLGKLDRGNENVYNSRTGNRREVKFGEHGVRIQNKRFLGRFF